MKLWITCLLYIVINLLSYEAYAIDLSSCPVKFVTGALRASDGRIWVVGEGAEPCYLVEDYANEGWHRVSMQKGFPETVNFYGLAEDKQGRIWVGTDRYGVAVYNGTEWKVYGKEEALPGERVFSIAVSPANGDVAVATSGGVAIYRPEPDEWFSVTRADGLPEDQIYAVHFDAEGRLWAGFSCSGIGAASAGGNYRDWKYKRTNWYWDREQHVPQPREQAGEGLPSNLVNALATLPDGSVWAGTVAGLGYKKGTADWRFCRGEDFKDKNKGLYQPRGTGPGFNTRYPRLLLPEDFITSLRAAGNKVLIGFRHKGACLLDPETFQIVRTYGGKGNPLKCKWVNSFIRTGDRQLWAGTFGGGMELLDRQVPEEGKFPVEQASVRENIPFPGKAAVLPPEELEACYQKIAVRGGKKKRGEDVIFYGDDWSTRGDWCYRYGRDYAMLCAANAPLDNVVYETMCWEPGDYDCSGSIGPNNRKDGLRNWVETINDRGNHNVLASPDYCIRTESEWDDHGEAYPRTFDGPDVWIAVKLPKGRHLVSVYFYNPNGRRNAHTALRDYLVEVRKMTPQLPEKTIFRYGHVKEREKILSEHAGSHLPSPVLARTRVNYFAGSGVHKSFLMQGPGCYYIRVARNHSFNTIVNGVLMTCLSFRDRKKYDLPQEKAPGGRLIPRAELRDLLDVIYPGIEEFRGAPAPFLSVEDVSCVVDAPSLARYKKYLLESVRSEHGRQLKWCLNIPERDHERIYDQYLADVWERQQFYYPFMRSGEWARYSPNVIPFSVEEVKAMEAMNIDWKQYLAGNTPDIPVKEVTEKIKKFLLENKKEQTAEKQGK